MSHESCGVKTEKVIKTNEIQIDDHMYLAVVQKSRKYCSHSRILDFDWLIHDDEIQQYPSFRILHNHQKFLQYDLKRSQFAKNDFYNFSKLSKISLKKGLSCRLTDIVRTGEKEFDRSQGSVSSALRERVQRL